MDVGWLDASRRIAEDAVAAMSGRVVSLEVREVHTRPDGEWVAGFDAMVEWQGSAPCAELLFVGADDDAGTARAWRYPDDPLLLGLAAAVDPVAVAAFLGVAVVSLEVVTLRPCRRAVVRARGEDVDVHLKVVAPGSVTALVDRHLVLADAGVPVPGVVAADAARGWVALTTLPGRTLDECLDTPGEPLVAPTEVWSLVESIAAVRLEPTSEVPAASLYAAHHARVIGDALPALGTRARRLADRISSHRGVVRPGTVHGDLHPGQLLVDQRGRLTGVLDVDGVGVGDVHDDTGRIIAHVMVAAALGRSEPDRRWRFAGQLVAAVGASLTADELSQRVAASVVAHATGPWRAQTDGWPHDVDRLLTLAEQVLDDGVAAAIRSRRSP